MGIFAKYLKIFLNPEGRYRLWVFLIAIVICVGMSIASRYNQKRAWDKAPEFFYVHGTPMMTTLDAFLYLRYAKESREERYVAGSIDRLRNYPGGMGREKLPFVSYLVSWLSRYFDWNLYLAGNYMVIFAGSIFIIPLMLYFHRLGLPAAGILGAIAGSFSLIYLIRTSIGRVDTDCLNLLFPFLASYFILLSTRDKSPINAILFGALSGLSMYMFIVWYEHPQFAYLYGVIFAVYLVSGGASLTATAAALVFYTIFAFPTYALPLLSKLSAKLCSRVFSPDEIKAMAFYVSSLYIPEIFSAMFAALEHAMISSGLSGLLKGLRDDRRVFAFSLVLTLSLSLMWFTRFQVAQSSSLLFVVVFLFLFATPGQASILDISLRILVLCIILAVIKIKIPAIADLSIKYYDLKLYPVLLEKFAILMQYWNDEVMVFYGIFLKAGLKVKNEVYVQITELQRTPASTILSYVFERPGITAFGLGAFGLLLVTHFRKMLPLFPLFALGILSLAGSNRLVIYMAPFVGVGYGYVVHQLVSVLSERFKISERFKALERFGAEGFVMELATYVITAVCAVVLMQWQTAFSYIPKPSVDAAIFSSLEDIKKEIPRGSAIFTWWDLGYAIEDVTGAATILDGGLQQKIETVYVAHSFVNPSQRLLYNTVVFATGGLDQKVIMSRAAEEKILDTVREKEIYLLFTRDMIPKFQSMYSVSGLTSGRNLNVSDVVMTPLECQGAVNDVFSCGDNRIDVKNGLINDSTSIIKTVLIEKGKVKKEVGYFRPGNVAGGFYLLLFFDNNQIINIFLLNEPAFNSNLAQMFLLGNYNADLFERVYSNSLVTTLYRVKDSKQVNVNK
ncbi:MAG: hypothetical protein HQK89_08290 [Nitrospirae bacterium]|nr:hypothetical protein [Nitrospirota bacterium]